MPSVAERIKGASQPTTETPTPAPVEKASIPTKIPAPDVPAEEAVAQVTGQEPEPDDTGAEEGLSASEIADLMDDDDDDEPVEEIKEEGGSEPEPPAEETPEEKAEPAAEEPAGEEQAAAEPESETPAEEQVATPEASTEEQQVETPEQVPQRTQEELQKDYDDAYKGLVEDLAATTYALNEEEAQALIAEPETILPKFAARIHAEVLVQAAQGVMNQLPAVLQNFNAQQKANEEYRNAFFSKWPKLAAHEADVYRMGQAYRQQNPKVSQEQAIQEIGTMAMVMLKIPFEDQPQQGAAEIVTSPPVPAGAGNVPPPAPKKRASGDNFYSQMAEEYLEEDMG